MAAPWLTLSLLLPARHWLNLAGLLVVIWFGREFVVSHDIQSGMTALVVMTVISLLFGVHMVMAIGGADMPVVVSMLNSYSGWAAAGIGFSLNNSMLIIAGSLVGSSGAILSYIMCKAMNRSFFNVILGGFGGDAGAATDDVLVYAHSAGALRWLAGPPLCATRADLTEELVEDPRAELATLDADETGAVELLDELRHAGGLAAHRQLRPHARRDGDGELRVIVGEPEQP